MSVDGVASATGSSRPIPGGGPHEIVAFKQPFTACGKLRPEVYGARRVARSAQMPLDKSVPLIRRSRRLINS
jgi:hypothetical protein